MKLSGQRSDRKLLWLTQERAAVFAEFQSMEHFKQELIEYPDYYNNRRIKAKLKGLPPAIHRQQALSAAYTIFAEILFPSFWGHFKPLSAGSFV